MSTLPNFPDSEAKDTAMGNLQEEDLRAFSGYVEAGVHSRETRWDEKFHCTKRGRTMGH